MAAITASAVSGGGGGGLKKGLFARIKEKMNARMQAKMAAVGGGGGGGAHSNGAQQSG